MCLCGGLEKKCGGQDGVQHPVNNHHHTPHIYVHVAGRQGKGHGQGHRSWGFREGLAPSFARVCWGLPFVMTLRCGWVEDLVP